MATQPILRPFETEDTDVVVEIANLAWQGIYASQREILGDELYAILCPEDLHRKGNEMRGRCMRTPDHIWICGVNGRVAGFIMWSMNEEKKIGTLGNNGLHPEFAGRGLGTFMYRGVLAHFRANGMSHAMVHTGLDEGHAPARRAYERVGFDIRQESVNYYMKLM
ncbi:MAG: GNAT family N-acetyltransferase [Victivallales bacterium]|jgi:ribosomal protein S18 acetylase RimI-like enzyme|nr:GNAT family N-acetyltransferase [Victivallales bacterium]MBT7304436.1 GNAT family N-acetyltransferase [Victivallales bacterium]